MTCHECSKPAGVHGFEWHLLGKPLVLCPMCAGKLCGGLVRYFAGRKKDGIVRAAPRNPNRPIVDVHGQARCRQCETQLGTWTKGESPLCVDCGTTKGVSP